MGSVQLFKIKENRRIARDTYLLELVGDTSGLVAPGQFVNVTLPGFYLRRPFSVCAWKPGLLTLMYKVLGEGTEELTKIPAGTTLEVLSNLGNGFKVAPGISRPLVVGGGVGVAPMLALVEALLEAGTRPLVILGFGAAEEVALEPEIAALGVKVVISTVDGSAGVPGFVTDAMASVAAKEGVAGRGRMPWDYVYACGPTPMLKAVFAQAGTRGQYSMEERMACGFGACMGCVLETKDGLARVCKEGPVFESEDLPW